MPNQENLSTGSRFHRDWQMYGGILGADRLGGGGGVEGRPAALFFKFGIGLIIVT